MRKHNFAGHVNIITPQPREVVHSARLPWSVVVVGLSTLVVEKLLDPRGAGMYLYLHNPRQGEPSAQTQVTRSQDRCPAKRRRSQPPPRGRQRRDLRRQRLLRPRDLVQVRYENGTACAHRRPTHRRDSNALRRVPAHLLQAQCRVRARGHLWPFAQESAVPRVATNYVQRSSRRCGRRARRTPPWMPPRSWNS